MVVLMDSTSGKQSGPQDPLRKKRNAERQYVFDVTFGADSSQQEVYDKTTKPLVHSVLEGFNATVFAYGATGISLVRRSAFWFGESVCPLIC